MQRDDLLFSFHAAIRQLLCPVAVDRTHKTNQWSDENLFMSVYTKRNVACHELVSPDVMRLARKCIRYCTVIYLHYYYYCALYMLIGMIIQKICNASKLTIQKDGLCFHGVQKDNVKAL